MDKAVLVHLSLLFFGHKTRIEMIPSVPPFFNKMGSDMVLITSEGTQKYCYSGVKITRLVDDAGHLIMNLPFEKLTFSFLF